MAVEVAVPSMERVLSTVVAGRSSLFTRGPPGGAVRLSGAEAGVGDEMPGE
ncbi:MAG: hypothetical protein H0U02_01280 [Rubrobacter sp.]|nr:hypothetical protein [Rubrobacter sp.]